MAKTKSTSKSVSLRRREEILIANVFSRPEWQSTTAKAKRLQTNTRRAVTAIGELMAIIKDLPITQRIELQSDLDQLTATSDLLSHVARIFEHGKENSERAVKRAEAERAAQRKADVERLVIEMFGSSPAPDVVQACANDLLQFDARAVAEAFAKSKGFHSGFVSINQHWEIRHALNGPIARLASLLATERLDMHKRGVGFTDNLGERCISFGWLDFEDWRVSKGQSKPS